MVYQGSRSIRERTQGCIFLARYAYLCRGRLPLPLRPIQPGRRRDRRNRQLERKVHHRPGAWCRKGKPRKDLRHGTVDYDFRGGARGWTKPIRLLRIDGDHRYESTKLDFALWEPHGVEGGILAMHDTISKKGPKRVLWEYVFRSGRFQEIAIVDSITAFRKVERASLLARLRECMTLTMRAIYIAARKSRAPHSKEFGRKLLRQVTAQTWLPMILLVFSANIARYENNGPWTDIFFAHSRPPNTSQKLL